MEENMENTDIKKEKKTNKKKFIILFVILLIIAVLGGFAIYKYFDKLKLENEKELNEKIEKCYTLIKDSNNFEEFKEIVSTINDKNDKNKAYSKFSEALDNLIDNLYSDYNVGKSLELYDFFKTMTEDQTIDSQLTQIIETKNKYRIYTEYVITAKQDIEEKNYHGAYIAYSSAIKEITNIDKEKSEAIKKKRDAIKDKACESLKKDINKHIKENDYSAYYVGSEEEFIKNNGDEELKSIYDQYLKKKKAEKEAKEKAKKKQQGVRIGMSEQDVLDSSWGKPTKINKSVYSWGTYEQWVYPNYNYLYFENGKLTSIQTNE